MISLIWKLLAACFLYDISKRRKYKDIDSSLDEDNEDDNILPNKKKVKKPTKKYFNKI